MLLCNNPKVPLSDIQNPLESILFEYNELLHLAFCLYFL
nr:MAG TPA: hypothetical protein [Caudoviricetes sp.]